MILNKNNCHINLAIYNLLFKTSIMLRKPLIIFTLLSLDFIFLAGQPIHYDYDDSGNRVKRYIILGKGGSSEDKISKEFEESKKTEEYEDELGELTIKIFPNPTKGQLYVEIEGLSSEQTIDYQVFSQTGLLLNTKRKNGIQFTIDMEKYSSGIYILRLMIEGKISQWKILKE